MDAVAASVRKERNIRVYTRLLYSATESFIVMITQGVDTHFILLHGHALLGDVIPLCI